MSASYSGLYDEGEGEKSQRDRSLSLEVSGVPNKAPHMCSTTGLLTMLCKVN